MKQFTVRFADDVYLRARRQADRKGVSLNSYLQSLVPIGDLAIEPKKTSREELVEKAYGELRQTGKRPTISQLCHATGLNYGTVWNIAQKLGVMTQSPKELRRIQARETLERETLPLLRQFLEDPKVYFFTITHGDPCTVNFKHLSIEMSRDYSFEDEDLLPEVIGKVKKIVSKYSK